MKRLLFFLVIVLAATGVFWSVNSREEATADDLESEEPLLLLDDAEPLEELDRPAGPAADNSRCHVCHINYETEELAVQHARADIGCEKCHGPSDAHCADEDNITPPDIMYSMAKINTSCMATACHPKDEIDDPNHRTALDYLAADKTYCTNCHGEHILSHRTRRWDKKTGKLIEDDKVRMLTSD